MNRTTRRTALLAAAVLAASMAVLPASAVPTWLPQGPVGPAFVKAFSGAIAVDAAGNAVAMWPAADSGENQMQASSRPAGGPWGAPIPVSVPGATAVFPEMVLADDGSATAVWFRSTGVLSFGLQSATRSPNGVWSAVVDIAGGSGVGDRAALGLLPDGGAVVVWPRFVGGFWYEYASVRSPDGAWSNPVDISPPATTDSGQPALGVDAAGNTTVVWTRYDGANNIIETSTRSSAGVWSQVQPLSQMGQDAIYPSVAVDPAGTATAVWARFDSTRYIAQSSTRTAPGGLWSAPVNLSHTLLSVSNTQVATSSGGRVVATWRAEPDGAPSRVQAAIRPPGAAWAPGVDLSDTTADAIQPRVVVAVDGAATVVWTWFNGAVNVVQGASAPAGAAFGAAVTLSSDAARDAFPPRLAVDSHGDVAVFWSDVGPMDQQANYRVYDVAGPVLGTVTSPTAGTAGKAMSFSASATDTWSSVASYAWSFGDGTTATGASASHTYAAKGSYSVTLTVTDAAGNSTTRTAATAVAAPVPKIALFKLKKKAIATDEKTKLKVRLNTASTLKLVFKSKHRHLVKGKKKYLKVVLTKRLPAGKSKITVKAKVKGTVLKPDAYVLSGVATNSSGKSPTKKAQLRVVRP